LPATFDRNLGVYVRKPQLTQVFDAWEGWANAGVPFNLVSVSSDTVPAATIRNLGNGGALKVLNKAGLPLFVIDETGISTISFGGGTVSSPSITMGTDPDTGWYKPDFDRIGMALGGVKKFDFRAGHMEFVDQLEVNLGAITADKQALFTTAQWNNVAVTFTHNKLNIIDTTSASASLITDWQVNGISQFSVRKDGLGTFRAGLNITTGAIQIQDATTARISSTAAALRLNAGTGDLIFERAGGQVGRFRASDNFLVADIGLVSAGSLDITGDAYLRSIVRITSAAGKIVPGATSISFRNNADTADNLLIDNAGNTTLRSALFAASGAASTFLDLSNLTTARLRGGTTSFAIRNSGDSADNLLITDAGIITARNNFGLGITPSAWQSGYAAIQMVGNAVLAGGSGSTTRLMQNSYINGTFLAIITGPASKIEMDAGIKFSVAPSVTAGLTQTYIDGLAINTDGSLSVQGATIAVGAIRMPSSGVIRWPGSGVNNGVGIGFNTTGVLIVGDGTGNVATSATATAGGIAIPTASGFITASVNGATVKIPYCAN
jgi:hypothetical protein